MDQSPNKKKTSNGGPPVLRFNTAGNLVNVSNVGNTRQSGTPAPPPACAQTLGTGFQNGAFQACFASHVNSLTRTAFKQANSALANQTKMNALCHQRTIAPHQISIYEMAKIMAATPTEKMGEHRGTLCWMNTGSGKTVTSLAVIMAYWNSPKRIVVVSSKSNITQALQSYLDDAPRFFGKECAHIASDYRDRKSASHLTDVEAFTAALNERVKGLTFVEARNRLASKSGEFKTIKSIALHEGEGSVMIIDEAQGLAMKSRADPKGDAIKLGCTLRRLSKEKLRKIHVFAMTATPGNTIKQWLKLLSVVRRADQLPFALDNDAGTNSRGQRLCEPTTGGKDDTAMVESALRAAQPGPAPPSLVNYVKNNFSGMVAYVDLRRDLSRHACVKEVSMRVPLDKFYYLALLRFNVGDRLKADRTVADLAQHRFDPRMPDAFMRRLRLMGETLPKTVWSTLPKEIQDALRSHRRILRINDQSEGRLVSPKFIKLTEALSKPGKQYCYTVNGNENVLSLALHTWYGMTDVTRLSETFNGAHVNKANRVVGLKPGNHLVVLNDTTPSNQRKRLVKIFNHPENADGKYIRVVIASGQLYEGLDLSGLRFVHLAEPMVTPLHELQAIGRGVRNCAHRGLALKDRNVTIVRWYTAAPAGGWTALHRLLGSMKGLSRGRITAQSIEDEFKRIHGMTYDEVVFQRARNDPDFFTLQKWESIMKAMAFDCDLMKRYNPDVSCGRPMIPSKIVLSAGAACAS